MLQSLLATSCSLGCLDCTQNLFTLEGGAVLGQVTRSVGDCLPWVVSTLGQKKSQPWGGWMEPSSKPCNQPVCVCAQLFERVAYTVLNCDTYQAADKKHTKSSESFIGLRGRKDVVIRYSCPSRGASEACIRCGLPVFGMGSLSTGGRPTCLHSDRRRRNGFKLNEGRLYWMSGRNSSLRR